MASSRSQARIEARIVERVAHCCQFELKDPRAAFVTITGCKVTADLSIARISYTVMGSESDRSKVAHMLEHAGGFVRKQVGRVLETRRIPMLHWEYDQSVELQIKMESAISEALAKDRLINPKAHGESAAASEPVEEELLDEELEDETSDEASGDRESLDS